MEWSELSNDELVQKAADSPGHEPAARWQAQAEGTRRLLSSIDDLRSEARSASDRLNVLTWALVIATVALLIVGVITLVKVW
jgi:hypothetical protein